MAKQHMPSEVVSPECAKMLVVKDKSQSIGEFLEWLQAEKHWILCSQHEHTDDCYENKKRICHIDKDSWYPEFYTIEQLLAEFFEIDLAKVEQEKRAILTAIQEEKV